MNAVLDDTFVGIIDGLSVLDEETNGRPQLADADRPQAIAGLKRLLVYRQALEQHIRHLQKRFRQNFRNRELLDEELAERIVNNGADEVLSNDQLAFLLLNPIALSDLAFRINEAVRINEVAPEYWLDCMSAVGEMVWQSEIGAKNPPTAHPPAPMTVSEQRSKAVGPNLFAFATSELSQDAFICWLAAWADPAHRAADLALHTTATAFLDRLLERGGVPKPAGYQSVRVRPQFHDIDVLLEVNGEFAVIIEDKTETKDHSNQLPRYVEVVRRELKFPDERIAAIYLKTGDQSNYRSVEQAGYGRFLRRDFLEVLDQGERAGVRNAIFADFRSSLHALHESVESYKTVPLGEWNQDWNRWKGFFMALQERLGEGDWDYVANRAGGFMGFHWHWRDNKFLQLENDELRFKIMVPDEAQQPAKRDEWRADLIAKKGTHGINIRPSVRREGRYMTVAVLEGDYRQPKSDGTLDFPATVDVLNRASSLMDEAATPGKQPESGLLT